MGTLFRSSGHMAGSELEQTETDGLMVCVQYVLFI